MANLDKIHIGIFRALHLGDLLCIIPTVRAIRAAFPNACITLIGLSWQKSFVHRFHHYFDDFIDYPGWPGLPEKEVHTEAIAEFLQFMQKEHFDLILQMHGNGDITNTMCMLWGADRVAGLRRPGGYCPDEKLFPVSEDNEHEILRFLKLADVLNIPRKGVDLEFPFFEEEAERFSYLRNFLHIDKEKYICVHPGARDIRRRWPPENFAFIADHFASRGYRIVLTGSEAESALLEKTESMMRFPVINTIKQLHSVSLGELAMFIQHSALLLSNDTGVSHIAAALKAPSVIIFSPFSDRQRWAPLNTALHTIITNERAKDTEYVIARMAAHLENINQPSTALLQ